MKRIDTSEWKEFRVGKWFETEKNGKQVPTGASIPKLELKENGSTPRISVTGINNGILGYFDYIGSNVNNYRVYQNFVSVSFLGTVFYQKGSASLDMKVHCLKPLNIELNEYTGSFLVAAIKASLKNYAYSDQLSSTVLPNVNIKLPATPSGEPDWEYMENYMRKYEQQTNASITVLKHLTETQKPKHIDTSKWKRFPLYSEHLFTVEMGNKMDRIKMSKDAPSVNFVGRGSVNNGVVDYVDIVRDVVPYKAGCLTLSLGGSVGATFIQEKDFYTSQNVCVLIPKWEMSIYCKRFISTMITCEGQRRYKAFVDELNRHIKTDFSILLPVTSSGEPDWNLMEQYMRQVELQVKNSILALTTPTPQVQQQTNLVNYGTVNIYEK